MKKIFFLMLSASLLLLAACSKDEDTIVQQEDKMLVTNEGVSLGDPCFSVSSTKKVVFSPGNLQYNASTNTWRFAEHQWDVVGSDNESISASYDGWIDLFGWGTGNNPTMYSGINSDYTKNVVIWDTNVSGIKKLGDGWFTLSKSEWEYLLNRSGKSALATIGTVTGLVLLPNSFIMPAGCSFTSGYGSAFTTNIYSFEQWAKMENAGAVFLPAAGRRDEQEVIVVGSTGAYWSSEKYNASTASSFNFSKTSVKVGNTAFYYGQCVRLVRENSLRSFIPNFDE